ncbi:MAG: D-inositol-3-phosphate glycosyltransferase, partial [Thermoleophilaceae bacterium]|nr:D-inositol-3-phosphate glycosyltransferase [Thermoleophilaceae bacterium]
SDALIARGDSVRLITSHRGRPGRRDEDGLEVVRQFRPPERALNRLGFPPGTSHAPLAWLALRRGQDDVVQAWTAATAVAAARSGKPSVFVFQGVLDPADLAGRPRVHSMLLSAARRCDAVTAYSEVAAEAFATLMGVEARAIEPGIRLDAFTPGGRRNPAPAIFCAADAGEPRKRVRLLVDAFARVRRERPDAELWLMDTNDPSTAGADGVRIVDPGANRDELVRLYRSAWVSVLPAFREAFGLVVVESLACGTPVIGMRDGGAVPGILGTPGVEPDEASLATALLEAIEQPPDAGTAGACRARAGHHSIERCAERYEALYREIGA